MCCSGLSRVWRSPGEWLHVLVFQIYHTAGPPLRVRAMGQPLSGPLSHSTLLSTMCTGSDAGQQRRDPHSCSCLARCLLSPGPPMLGSASSQEGYLSAECPQSDPLIPALQFCPSSSPTLEGSWAFSLTPLSWGVQEPLLVWPVSMCVLSAYTHTGLHSGSSTLCPPSCSCIHMSLWGSTAP